MGGKAFEGVTRRVSKGEVLSTVKWLSENWVDAKLQPGDYRDHLLGSAGKNNESGDIDLNLNIDLFDQEQVASNLKALLGEDHVKPRPGNNQIFTAVPVNGDPAKGYVQVDFMFGDYEWQKFSYHSSALMDFDPKQVNYWWGADLHNSYLKGLYRTELIKALVAFNSDWVLEEDGEMIARVGPTFFHDKGCVWRYRHRPMRKDGQGRIQELKELTEAEFMALYPSALKASNTVCKDPEILRQMLLNDWTQVHHFNTFETLWNSIRNCYDKPDIEVITKIYLERLNNLKVEIPTKVFKAYRLKV